MISNPGQLVHNVETRNGLRYRRIWVVLFTHSVGVSAALVLAWLLRFDFSLPRLRLLWSTALILVGIRWMALYCFKLIHGHWRYTGIGDLKDLLKTVFLGSLAFFILVRWIYGVVSFPLSIYVMEGVLSFLFLAGLRVGVRIVVQSRESRRLRGARKSVLVVGAGSAAVQLLQWLMLNNYNVVGLVDDDPAKWKTKLCGAPVLGSTDELPLLSCSLAIDEILIAIPSATAAQMFRITDFCARSGVPFRAVPGLADLVEGRVTISEFREVNLDELLGREPVRLEADDVSARLRGRVAMVTGAAGSIGSELCKQIIQCRPRKLICVDQAETPLFNLQQHVLAGASLEIVYSVTDVTDTERMRQLLLEHEVAVIFHAAAYKHVPMTEANPYEGLKNNVFGLLDLVEAAEECKCEDFLLISSDKAVKPSSMMGCTKRLGEMIVSSRESKMRCVSVRFGNVLGSQGSVIPVFQEQIRTLRRITVTHPEMTRFFMTIPEAVSLVLQAFTVGEHGNILVLDMGKPVRILDLAKTLIRASGNRENDVQIVYTGMRPGEKLHEELFYDTEVRLHTSLSKVMRAQMNLPVWPVFNRRLQELRSIACRERTESIRAKVKQMIPEYQWEQHMQTQAASMHPALMTDSNHLANQRKFAKFA